MTQINSEHKNNEKIKLNRDKVVWLNDVLDRFTENALKSNYKGISRVIKVNKLAALLEIMDVLGLEFEDRYSAINALTDMPEFDIIEPKAECETILCHPDMEQP